LLKIHYFDSFQTRPNVNRKTVNNSVIKDTYFNTIYKTAKIAFKLFELLILIFIDYIRNFSIKN